MFQIVGAVAEFEKDIIKERVIAGLANARLRGKRLGRPPKAEAIYEKARLMRSEGLSFRKIGKQLGVLGVDKDNLFDIMKIRISHYQITIPNSMRKKFTIAEGDYMEVERKNDEIVLKPIKMVHPDRAYFLYPRMAEG